MNNMKKKMTAVVAALAMVSASGASVFAEKVIFEDSFERASWTDNNFYISAPEVKVYGENLITDGDFENGQDIGRYSGNQTAYGINSVGVANTYLAKSEKKARNGSWSLCIDPTADTTKVWSTNNYPMLTVRGDKFGEGIYEIEAWVYTDAPNYVIRLGQHYNYSALLSTYGNISSQVALGEGKWTKIRSTISVPQVEANIKELAFCFNMVTNWAKNGDVYYPLYIDDVKVRKVENAIVTNNSALDNGNTRPSNQNGMGRYTMEGIISTPEVEKNVETLVTVNNVNGEDDYEVSIVSALYAADGTLMSVLGNKTETVYAGTENYELVSNFVVPAGTPTSAKLVTYCWDNVENVKPHTVQYVYPYHMYKVMVNDDNTINYLPAKRVPETMWCSVPYYSDYGSHAYTPAMFDQVMVGNGRSGMNSLFIPLTKTYGVENGVMNRGYVYKDFEVEEGHTYEIEFYAMCEQDYLAVYVFDKPGFSITKSTNWTNSGKGLPLTNKCSVNMAEGSRIYQQLDTWTPVKVEFTAAASGTYSVAFTQGANGYMDKNAGNKGCGAFLDDVKITDLTAVAE